jgi:hypothetical protein
MNMKRVLKFILVGVLMSKNYCNAQSVQIETVPGQPIAYTSLESLGQAKNFAMDLSEAREDQIQIEDVESGSKVETAVKIVLENTVKEWVPGFRLNGDFASVPDERKPMLAVFLWEIQEWLFMCSINSALYCLNRLHEIASSDFEKAKLLLVSQCENAESFKPIDGANWNVIGNAVLMLKREKNGHAGEAQALLAQLKALGDYEALLGK